MCDNNYTDQPAHLHEDFGVLYFEEMRLTDTLVSAARFIYLFLFKGASIESEKQHYYDGILHWPSQTVISIYTVI